MRKSFSLNLAAGVLGVGLAAAPSFADIKVNDQLSLSGFLDMSATYNNVAFTPAGTAADEFTATFDQFELDFLYKFTDKLTARVDVNSLGGGAMALEQGFLTYTTGPVAFTAGKFLSVSGWEAAEPTGMYQYDYSDAFVYGGYQNGVAVSYTVSPMIALYASVVDGIWVADGNLSRPGVEAQIALMPTKEITVKATNLFQQQPGYITDVVNVWGSYVMGPLTAAIEGNYLMNYTSEEDNGFGGLVMANYKLTDVFAVTGRYSMLSTSGPTDADADDITASEVTIAPSVTLLSNWFALAQAKYQFETEELGFAVETTVTF
jgi:hypothetical protein